MNKLQYDTPSQELLNSTGRLPPASGQSASHHMYTWSKCGESNKELPHHSFRYSTCNWLCTSFGLADSCSLWYSSGHSQATSCKQKIMFVKRAWSSPPKISNLECWELQSKYSHRPSTSPFSLHHPTMWLVNLTGIEAE